MPICIYCVRTDPPYGFNREHVIPEALGRFEGGLTLADSEVCADCNQYFGDTLDRFLTRDSAEATLRFRYGLKDPAEVGTMFRERVRVRLPQDGAKWGGAYFDLVPPPDGEREPYADLAPQFGCKRRDGSGWDYFTEEDLRSDPDAPARIARGCDKLRLIWYDNEETKVRLLALLAEKGITFEGGTEFVESLPLKGGRITPELQVTFDKALARAVTKIAFNYLAKRQGTAFMLRSEFDPVRRFVRYAEGSSQDFVSPQTGPVVRGKGGEPVPRWHVLALYWDRDREAVLCQVGLFNYLVYVVRLCQRFRGVWRQVMDGHQFDLETMKAKPLHRTRIAPPVAIRS